MKPKNRNTPVPGRRCVVIERNGLKTFICCAPELDIGSGSLDTQPAETTLMLPSEPFRLEEANLPSKLSASLAGQRVTVQILPEEEAGTRQVDPQVEASMWRDPKGNYWNDYQPERVFFTGPDGKPWRLPQRWVDPPDSASVPDIPYHVSRVATWREELHLPSRWDLEEINIDFMEALRAGGRVAVVGVHVAPRQPVKVLWRDSRGSTWRIPHDWRKRRIRLPGYKVLVSQEVPAEVAKDYADKIVSVNYHPGSLCCLPDGYRFRDGDGGKWPVKMRDCVLVGYGDKEEHRA